MDKEKDAWLKEKTHDQLREYYDARRKDKYIVVVAQRKRSESLKFLMNIYKDKKEMRDLFRYIVGSKSVGMKRLNIDLLCEYVNRLKIITERLDSTGFSEGDKEVIFQRIRTSRIITLQDINILELLILNTHKMFSTISETLNTWTSYLKDREL